MTANIQIFDNCTNLIRSMSQVKRCERNPNDVAKEPHEITHAPDAIRGFVRGRPIPYRPNKKVAVDYINKFTIITCLSPHSLYYVNGRIKE